MERANTIGACDGKNFYWQMETSDHAELYTSVSFRGFHKLRVNAECANFIAMKPETILAVTPLFRF